MAVSGSILVSWTSNYVIGCHRIGYRIQGSGDPYTIVDNIAAPYCNPGPVPAACSYALGPFSFENESCEEVTYEIYVQPCCQNPVSEDGRVYFNVTFVPDPSCIAVVFTCDSSPLPGGDCAGFSLGSPCDMTPDQLYPASGTIANGTSFSVCYVGGAASAPSPAGYSKLDDPLQCCYDCVTLNFVALNPDNSENGNITYIDCATGSVTTVAVVAGGIIPAPVCIKRGSVGLSNPLTPYTIGPVCTPP